LEAVTAAQAFSAFAFAVSRRGASRRRNRSVARPRALAASFASPGTPIKAGCRAWAHVSDRKNTYQTLDQFHCENAFIAAKAALQSGGSRQPSPASARGLHDLGIFVATVLRDRAEFLPLKSTTGRVRAVGISLFDGRRRGEDFNMVLLTHLDVERVHECVASLLMPQAEPPRELTLSVFDDGMEDDYVWYPDHYRHDRILLALLGRLVVELEYLSLGDDYNWHVDCCDGDCPEMDDTLHPDAMVAEVKRMQTEVYARIAVTDVMEG
jgi:hypothetical protein